MHFLGYISILPNIRQQGKIRHIFSDIISFSVCTVIAGAYEWEEIKGFGHERLGECVQ